MSENINQVALVLELAVTFFGVFLAFMLDRLIDWRKEQKAKEELLRNLACELNRMKDNLTGDAYRLYPDIWDSAVSSGQLKLLDSDQLSKLTNVYRKIKDTDYEATRVREAKEAFDENMSQNARLHLSFQQNEYHGRMEKTKELIDEVLKEPWLSLA
jgi:hypothetical protein